MSPNAFQVGTKMHKKIMQKFIDFLIEFLMNFGGFGKARTLDLIGRGGTLVGSSLFKQDPKNH